MIFLLSMMSDADAKRQSMVAGPNAAEKPVWHRQLALECLFNYFLQPEISDQLLNLYRMCYGSEPPLPLTPAKEATPEVQAGVESELSGDSGAVASQEANEEGSASMSRASATAALTDNVVERLMMSIESNIVAASTGKISAEVHPPLPPSPFLRSPPLTAMPPSPLPFPPPDPLLFSADDGLYPAKPAHYELI